MSTTPTTEPPRELKRYFLMSERGQIITFTDNPPPATMEHLHRVATWLGHRPSYWRVTLRKVANKTLQPVARSLNPFQRADGGAPIVATVAK